MNTPTALPAKRFTGLRFAPPAVGLPGSHAARQAWEQGVARVKAGQDALALPCFEQATRLAPRVSLYWLNRAGSERRLRQTERAIESARRAFALDAASPVACQMLAEMLRMTQQHADALAVLRLLDPATPRDTQHHLLEGAVQMSLRDWTGAAVSFLSALQQRPDDMVAYTQLGFALANLKQYGDAAECFRTITLLQPEDLGAAVYAAHYAAWACDWTRGSEDHQRLVQALALQDGRKHASPFSPFCLLSMNDDAALHLRAARQEAARIAAVVRQAAGWQPGDPGPAAYPQAVQALQSGRIRVGFVSADFRTHATSLLLVQTLERLDRSRFEVVLYSHGLDDASPLRRTSSL